MIGFNIEKTCIEAISKLASRSGRRGPHFGFTGRDDGKLEKDFQEALTNELGELTNSKKLNILWKREIRYKTRALTNNDYMTIDIVGVVENELVAAIELKYVTVYKNGLENPSDGYAFPYDIAKDCIKLELLVNRAFGGRSCSPGKNAPSKVSPQLQPCVIALTNWHEFRGGWSRNFGRQLSGTGPVGFANDPSKVLPRIEVDTKNLRDTIYLRKRAHISFGLAWEGQWRPYALVEVAGHATEFRYLLLKPANETTRPNWPNWDTEFSDTLPLSNTMRDEYDRIACHLKQSTAK